MELQPKLVEFVDVVAADLDHHRDTLGPGLHQPALEQALDRFAHRRAAHAEAGDEVALGNVLAGAERTGKDIGEALSKTLSAAVDLAMG